MDRIQEPVEVINKCIRDNEKEQARLRRAHALLVSNKQKQRTKIAA